MCHVLLLYPTERGIYGIANFSENQAKSLRRAMQLVIDVLQSQSELFDRIKVSVGLGRQSDDINELFESVREAENSVANRLISGAGRVIERSGGKESAEIVTRVITASIRHWLLKGVEILEANDIRGAIDDIARVTAAYEGMTGKAIVALCEECNQILRFGLKSQNALDDWTEEKLVDFHERLEMCNSQKDIFLLLNTYAASLIAHVTALRTSENNKPVREAQKYIQENFSSTINLENISQRVGFNPTYFSSLFKRETGMNFLEYLSDVRIKEAKRMLSDPRKTIADVAADVGYSDVKHFSKLFTRITGIHPSKYRKLYY